MVHGTGMDNSPVLPYWHEEEAKSVGTLVYPSKVYQGYLGDQGVFIKTIRTSWSAHEERKYRGNVVHLTLGFGNFEFWGKQRKITDYINDGYDVYKIGESILDEYIGDHDRPFRFVGIQYRTSYIIWTR